MNPLSDSQKQQIINVGLAYIAWVAISIFAWCFLLPGEWLWLAYLPAVFAFMAIMITGTIIMFPQLQPMKIEFVMVGRRRVTCCAVCQMHEEKENPFSVNLPIVRCREKAKVCYQPMTIPGWCPYAN